MSPHGRHLASFSTFAAVLLASGPGQAQTRKLNGPLATAYLTDVDSFDLAHGRVVYEESSRDLLTVPLNGGPPAQQLFHSERSFHSQLTPDGTRVLLTGALETENVTELFSLPADGSGPLVKLNAPLGPTQDVTSLQLSPDSRFVVYSVNGSLGPYSVRTDGSQPAVALAVQGGGHYAITADSLRVLYTDPDVLHTIPLDGSAPQRSIASFVEHGWSLAPDGSRVVYMRQSAGVMQLYSAPADGSAPAVTLNGPGSGVWRLQIAPDSRYVMYVAEQDQDGVQALYAAPLAGGPSVRFSAGVAGRVIDHVQVSPDHARVLFVANHDALFHYDLYSVPVDGSQPAVSLNAALPNIATDYFLDPLSGRALFGVATTGNAIELYSAPLDGSAAAVRLSPPGVAQGVPRDAFALAAGGRAVFLADPGTAGILELFSAPLDGSAPALRLHPPLVADGVVHSFRIDGTGTKVLYRAEQDLEDVTELFVVPVDGSAPPALRSTIREHLSTVGDVTRFALAPDGRTAVYWANESSARGSFLVNLDGSPQPVPLAQGLSGLLTPDFRRLLYVGSDGLANSVPLDGSAAPVSTGTALGNPRFSPDSSRFVSLFFSGPYSARDRMLSTPVAGGAATVELNRPRAVDGQIQWYEFGPDSSRVVYVAAEDSLDKFELYSVPLAGGAAPTKLNDTLVGGVVPGVGTLDIRLPKVSADSSRVVYLAERDALGEYELFSVPLAGGAPPTVLSALPGPDRAATAFAISPDSTRVVYVADQDSDEVYELYSVPLAGGIPTKLSVPSGPDRDVENGESGRPFLIGQDSSTVVYRADQDVDGVFDLYRVPLAGGEAPVRLTSGAASSQLTLITPDGLHVVFLQTSPVRNDLFVVPLAGGVAPVRLNGDLSVTLVSGPVAQVDDGWVLFEAAPEPDGVDELFVAPLHGLHAPLAVSGPLDSYVNAPLLGAFRPGTHSVVFLAERDEPGVRELYLDPSSTTQPGRHRRR